MVNSAREWPDGLPELLVQNANKKKSGHTAALAEIPSTVALLYVRVHVVFKSVLLSDRPRSTVEYDIKKTHSSHSSPLLDTGLHRVCDTKLNSRNTSA